MKYFSQSRQDEIVDKLLGKKENGVFVDFGAHDGVTYSNTLFFERHRNFSGLCVEPIVEVFEELKKNRNCELINGVIANETKTYAFKRVSGYSEMLSGIVEFRDERHNIRENAELEEMGGESEIIEVQGYKPTDLFIRFGIKNIDYLSIDIEGGELEVLEAIDFEKYHIRILTVENNYHDANIRKRMKASGYRLLFNNEADDFFVKKTTFRWPMLFANKEIFSLWVRNSRIFKALNF